MVFSCHEKECRIDTIGVKRAAAARALPLPGRPIAPTVLQSLVEARVHFTLRLRDPPQIAAPREPIQLGRTGNAIGSSVPVNVFMKSTRLRFSASVRSSLRNSSDRLGRLIHLPLS